MSADGAELVWYRRFVPSVDNGEFKLGFGGVGNAPTFLEMAANLALVTT